MSEREAGLLTRWSRRKSEVQRGVPAEGRETPDGEREPESAPASSRDTAARSPATPAADVAAHSLPASSAPTATAPVAAPPLPTLDDVARLTRESDYAPFMRPGVDPTVKNAAMKKLFADPHFNVMDGLDIYIDDYGKPDPLPHSMLRQLRQSAMLGLFDDDPAAPPAGAAGEANPDNAGIAAAAPSMPAAPPTEASCRAEDDPDLRLQSDDDDRRPGAGEGPRA